MVKLTENLNQPKEYKMVTTKELLANSKKLGRDNSDVDFDSFETPRYDLSQKKLSFKAYAKGSKDNLYKVEVAFYGVEPDGLTSEELAAGKHPRPKDLMDKQIKVDCDCYDYIFGGALKGNLHNGCALYTDAKLTNYKKKTDRPENNPENVPYACKHIVSFIYCILEAFK